MLEEMQEAELIELVDQSLYIDIYIYLHCGQENLSGLSRNKHEGFKR